MRVRLAFAIAAYLEPDILIIDEVLAVGDERFQRKCLGKMSDVAQHGRTILFVSHDLAAVQHLCTRVIAIRKGQIIADGKPAESIQKYLATIGDDKSASVENTGVKTGPWISVTHISQGPGTVENLLMFGKQAHIAFEVYGLGAGGRVMLEIYHESGALVSRFSSQGCNFDVLEQGATLTCIMDELLITPGRYRFAAGLFMQGVLLHHQENVASFEIRPGYLNGHRVSSYRESGYVHFGHRWELERSEIQTETGNPRTERCERELT
jgi:lipopolysaccharide transport system ATP-binding protein